MRIDMKKKQILTGVVERVDFPNKAVVKAQVPQPDESVATEYAIVKGALPGQTVEFSVKKARKNKCEGRLRTVLKKGQLETREAKCPNFGTCGGCNYQEIPYEQQLALKKEQVLRLIDAVYEGDGYQYDGILSVRKDGQYREWGYRNKMEFSFGDAVKDGPLTLGLHKKGSFHDIVDAEGCQIVHPDYSAVLACVREYAKENNTDDLFTANRDGMALFDGGRKLDISGRHYFRLAIDGIPNISDKLISRINGDEVFVISVPLSYNGEIVGTIQKVITFEEMYKICSLSIFSSQGYMYVINREGYVILHSAHPKCEQKSDNYFRDLYGAGNPKASEQMKRDIRNNRNGFIETTIAGREIFSAYTPIEKIHDWYLITSVPNNAVSPNGNTVISIFYFILFVIVVIFTSSLTYFLWYKNKQRAQLEKIAFVDTVTLGDTYNKFLVDAQGILTQCPHKKFHIIKFDIDNFKYINNFYGFEFGDRILRKINESISQQLNAHELIARIYSDHFVILLENAAEGRLNALLSSIENEEITLYFSAGIYSVTDSTESINLMVDKAGTAARSIKGVLNKKFAYYTNKFEQITIHNEQLKRAVKQALKNDEFIPYYQPKVDINSGILVGGEALVRWKTREGKFIFPNEFIPMCEQTGLIVELDMIMYEKVLKFLKSFLEQGLACVPISVNFSRLHLMDSDFLSKIVKKQCEYGVPAHLIEIELTESAIFDNIDTIYAFTRKMHANGFAIAMDDFGSGYSSLNMLKDIPIDVLKIDKGFLSEAADNNRRNIIFSSIADMARKLNIKVVVEGVEHLENVRLMKECGCSIAQGYYFAKPMDEESFRNVFKEGRIC